MALEQFEIKFPPDTPPVCTARLRREAGATEAGIHFAMPTRQPSTVDPALQKIIFQNSSLPNLSDPTLAGVQNVNLTSSGAPFTNDEVDDYEGDEGEQGYHLPRVTINMAVTGMTPIWEGTINATTLSVT